MKDLTEYGEVFRGRLSKALDGSLGSARVEKQLDALALSIKDWAGFDLSKDLFIEWVTLGYLPASAGLDLQQEFELEAALARKLGVGHDWLFGGSPAHSAAMGHRKPVRNGRAFSKRLAETMMIRLGSGSGSVVEQLDALILSIQNAAGSDYSKELFTELITRGTLPESAGLDPDKEFEIQTALARELGVDRDWLLNGTSADSDPVESGEALRERLFKVLDGCQFFETLPGYSDEMGLGDAGGNEVAAPATAETQDLGKYSEGFRRRLASELDGYQAFGGDDLDSVLEEVSEDFRKKNILGIQMTGPIFYEWMALGFIPERAGISLDAEYKLEVAFAKHIDASHKWLFEGSPASIHVLGAPPVQGPKAAHLIADLTWKEVDGENISVTPFGAYVVRGGLEGGTWTFYPCWPSKGVVGDTGEDYQPYPCMKACNEHFRAKIASCLVGIYGE